MPVSGNDTILNSTLVGQLNTDFGSYASFADVGSSSVSDFDTNVLFPRKTRFMKGGVYLST